jgi:hypothetical protein
LLGGCHIIVYGTLNKDVRRESSGKWEWDDASAVAAVIEAAESWDSRPDPNQNPFPHDSLTDVSSLQATQAFLEELHEFSYIAAPMVCDTCSPTLELRTRRFGRNLMERAVIEERTIECFRIPFRHHRQLRDREAS